MKNICLLMLTAICTAFCSQAYADQADGMEKARIKACKGRSAENGDDTQWIDIPLGAGFTIPAKKSGTGQAVAITQTNFPAAAGDSSAANIVIPTGYSVKIEKKDGVSFARIALGDKQCVYLEALSPVLDTKESTLSGIFVEPDWNVVSTKNTAPPSYRYLTSIDPAYFVASSVGRNLQYVVHEMSTGAYANHDKVNNVEVDNDTIKYSIGYHFRSELDHLNQVDVNIIDYEKLGSKLAANDFKAGASVDSLIAEFRKNVKPPAHSKLIVVLPLRQPATFVFTNGTVYGSKVEGLGFYVDYRLATDSMIGSGTGTFDVFLNCQALVIDVDSAKVIATRDYVGGKVFTAALSANGSVFDSLNGNQMFSAALSIVDEGVSKLVADLFVPK